MRNVTPTMGEELFIATAPLLFALLFLTTIASPTVGQAVEDTAIVDGGEVKDKPSFFGDAKLNLSRGDTVLVLQEKKDYSRISYGGRKGWISNRQIMSPKEREEYRRKIEAQRRRARQRARYIRGLREKGYTIVLTRQTLGKNSADGISVGLGLVNISQSRTVKYARITWKLFNSVGDPTEGKNSGRPIAKTKLVGPIEPGKTGYTEFENVWYSPVGTCAEIRGIQVEHIDGSSFTYINDLKDIAQEAESVRLAGDCSYEAQQEREN